MGRVLNFEDFKHPQIGELAFSARFGVRRVSSISECGWWYYFEGENTSVNRPSVRRLTKAELSRINA